jgi:lipoprotein-anchoring transpeptidase ErfK/SrfK
MRVGGEGRSGSGSHGVAAFACLLTVTGLLAAISPAAASAAGAARSDPLVLVLSNETTSTTWAEAAQIVPIRASPSAHAAAITSLSWQTPDAEAIQSYLLLEEKWTSSGAWVELRVPMRPNGHIGWVQRGALGSFNHTNMQIVVNRAAETLRLYRAGRQIFEAPVGVGKPSTPTPPGHFWITEAFPSTDPFYGPWAFGTSDYAHDTEFPDGSIVGLHGTNEPSLIPGDPSHGCIRLRDSDIVQLESLVSIGVPLLIE